MYILYIFKKNKNEINVFNTHFNHALISFVEFDNKYSKIMEASLGNFNKFNSNNFRLQNSIKKF